MSLHKSWSQECLAFLKEIQEIPGDKIVEYESRMRFGSGDFDMDGEKLKSCEEDSLLEHWHRVIWRKDDGGGWVNVKRLTGQVKANGEPEEIVRSYVIFANLSFHRIPAANLIRQADDKKKKGITCYDHIEYE